MPIAVFSVLYNVTRFFELRTVVVSYVVNATADEGDANASSSEVVTYYQVERTDLRADPA